MEHRGFLGNETVPYDTIMMDTCPSTSVKTYRIYNTKSETQCKLWTFINNKIFITTNVPHQCKMLTGETVSGTRKGYGTSLYYLLNFLKT